jgi:hypothetical protein
LERLSLAAKEVTRRTKEEGRIRRKKIQKEEEEERATTERSRERRGALTTKEQEQEQQRTKKKNLSRNNSDVPHAHIRLASRRGDQKKLRVLAASDDYEDEEEDEEIEMEIEAGIEAEIEEEIKEEIEEERKRVARERGWNDTVGSPARGSGKPPLFSANLDTQRFPPAARRTRRKKKKTKSPSGKLELRSDGLDRPVVSITPDNPAWVGAGRRTSMFGTPRTNSVQQNHRGTILTPASEVFNERR